MIHQAAAELREQRKKTIAKAHWVSVIVRKKLSVLRGFWQ